MGEKAAVSALEADGRKRKGRVPVFLLIVVNFVRCAAGAYVVSAPSEAETIAPVLQLTLEEVIAKAERGLSYLEQSIQAAATQKKGLRVQISIGKARGLDLSDMPDLVKPYQALAHDVSRLQSHCNGLRAGLFQLTLDAGAIRYIE